MKWKILFGQKEKKSPDFYFSLDHGIRFELRPKELNTLNSVLQKIAGTVEFLLKFSTKKGK
jgi:hypothetical protein